MSDLSNAAAVRSCPPRTASTEERRERGLGRVRQVLLGAVLVMGLYGTPGLAAPPDGGGSGNGTPPARPEVTFEAGAVEVDGLTPEGEVVLFGVARRTLGYHQRLVRIEEASVADATGYARFEIEDGVPLHAVWVAVDLATGGMAAGPTPGFPRGVRPFPTAGLHGGGGLPDRLGGALEAAQILYVRPGEGAWGTALRDGSVLDLDGLHNGSFEVALADFAPVNTVSPSAAPDEVAAGDLVVVVDSVNLVLFILRVTPDALH